jgi:hypothetical protein
MDAVTELNIEAVDEGGQFIDGRLDGTGIALELELHELPDIVERVKGDQGLTTGQRPLFAGLADLPI